MRRKELWRKAEEDTAPPQRGAKQYKYLFIMTILDTNFVFLVGYFTIL